MIREVELLGCHLNYAMYSIRSFKSQRFFEELETMDFWVWLRRLICA